jgi:hypothetical protein
MSLRRYVTAILTINFAGFLLLIGATCQPATWGSGWQVRMLVGIPILAALPTAAAGWSASKIPADRRTSFLAYGRSNIGLAIFWAVAAVSGAWVLLKTHLHS